VTDIQILAVAIGGQTVVVLIGIAGGVLYSNSRITDLKDATNKRFDDLRDLLRSEVKRIEDRIAHTRV
jgi:hypothetical protein